MKIIDSLIIIILVMNGELTFGYTYDANDFANQVISYSHGTEYTTDPISGQPYNNPQCALGRPTIDTTGDNEDIVPVSQIVPVVSVYPAFRYFELVTVGANGSLVLKFNRQVKNDPNNPYGIDFIVFGNTLQGSGNTYNNGDPNQYIIDSNSLTEEFGTVQVSQNGTTWFTFNNPTADMWAPTFGRIYDPIHPDTTIGDWNYWWGKPTDPTIPINPCLDSCDFAGKSLAYMSKTFGQSAGGTGFDLSDVGLAWIQYVKITPDELFYYPEVDAVADVKPCPAGDFDFNYKVDYADLQILSDYWLQPVNNPGNLSAIVNLYNDTIINFKDYAVFAGNWLISKLEN